MYTFHTIGKQSDAFLKEDEERLKDFRFRLQYLARYFFLFHSYYVIWLEYVKPHLDTAICYICSLYTLNLYPKFYDQVVLCVSLKNFGYLMRMVGSKLKYPEATERVILFTIIGMYVHQFIVIVPSLKIPAYDKKLSVVGNFS